MKVESFTRYALGVLERGETFTLHDGLLLEEPDVAEYSSPLKEAVSLGKGEITFFGKIRERRGRIRGKFAVLSSGDKLYYLEYPSLDRENGTLGSERAVEQTAETPHVVGAAGKVVLALDGTAPEHLIKTERGDLLVAMDGEPGDWSVPGNQIHVVGENTVVTISPEPTDVAQEGHPDLTEEARELIEEHEPDHVFMTM